MNGGIPQWREQALIWITALALFSLGVRGAARLAPGPFNDARTQVGVEARNLRWLAQGAEGPTSLVAGPGASIAALRHAALRRDDLLERTSTGLR